MSRVPCLLLLSLTFCGSPLLAQEVPRVEAQVGEIFERMAQAEPTTVWDQALALEALGKPGVPEIARRLDGDVKPAARVAAAKALLVQPNVDEHRGAAIRALKGVVRAEELPRELRTRASDLLCSYGLRSEVQPMMRDADGVKDPIVKIHLLKAVRVKGRAPEAERKLREFLTSDDFSVRCEAALVLASPEIGNVEAGREILARIKDEPTERGRAARSYLEMDDMLGKLERFEGLEQRDDVLKLRDREIQNLKGELAKLQAEMRKGAGASGGGGNVPGGKLFEELYQRIRETYVDEDKTKIDDLIDAAATGMVDHLDPFSGYMNEKSLGDFNSNIQQRYGGIGAVVQMDRKTGFLTIQRPIYGNPAYEAGLRTLDQVLEVEGTTTKGKSVQDLVEVLKGQEGTPVNVLLKPFFGGEPRPVQIVRRQITLKSVAWDLLPGQIGYLQLSQFGHLATDEVEEALVDLEGRGMRGLVLDLRGNPGGLLSAAVEIADKWLNDDQLVVYSEGRKNTRYGARQEDGGPAVRRKRLKQPKHPDYPLIVLIDENSASASEIVSGALQAHGRAELVGTTTFGKGSVQNIFPLESMSEKAALRMTIAYYYLPDGRCIHRPRHVETWRFRERMRAEIERWKQEGLLKDTQAKELLDQYQAQPGGVEPDYRVEAPELTSAQQHAYGLIFDLQLIEEYIRTHWAQHKAKFHELSRSDGFDSARYPGFEDLWVQVQEKLDQASKDVITKNDLRLLLRATVRRFVQDDVARLLTSDHQEDHQLQAALLLLAERTGIDLAQSPELGFLKKSFPEGVARTRKDQPPGEEKKSDEDGRDFK